MRRNIVSLGIILISCSLLIFQFLLFFDRYHVYEGFIPPFTELHINRHTSSIKLLGDNHSMPIQLSNLDVFITADSHERTSWGRLGHERFSFIAIYGEKFYFRVFFQHMKTNPPVFSPDRRVLTFAFNDEHKGLAQFGYNISIQTFNFIKEEVLSNARSVTIMLDNFDNIGWRTTNHFTQTTIGIRWLVIIRSFPFGRFFEH